MANVEWDVRGVSKKDGKNVRLTLRAPNQRAAELTANDRGMAVESCWPLQPTDQTVDAAGPITTAAPATGGGFWRLLRNLGLLALLIGGGALAAEWFLNGGSNENILVGGGVVAAAGLLAFLLFGLLGRKSRYRA